MSARAVMAKAVSKWMRGWGVRVLLVLLSLSAAFAGLVGLSHALRASLRNDERYNLAFTAIDCAPPASLKREDFLNQVRQQAGLPEQVYLLDDDLARKLAEAFAGHPWVRNVERVEVGPGQQVSVSLSYRRPVLAVPCEGKLRAVDAEGVLLPADALTTGLPRFAGTAFPPTGPPGSRWGDAAVETAAKQQAR